MVWIVIGNRTKTERVPGGVSVERRCPACGEVSTFYERRAVRTFRLYFLDVFDYDEQRVMACGACGTLYATDEHGAPSAATARGWKEALDSAADRVGGAVSRAGEALGPMWEQASENARELYEDASESLAPWAKRASEGLGEAVGRLTEEVDSGMRRLRNEPEPKRERPRAESEEEPDPEKAALLKRFEELERKMKSGDGD
jgi:hypothetical protein